MGLILARVYPPETFTTIQGTISSNIDGIRPPINGLLQSETTTSPQASLKPPFTTSRAPAPETIDRTSEPERSETKHHITYGIPEPATNRSNRRGSTSKSREEMKNNTMDPIRLNAYENTPSLACIPAASGDADRNQSWDDLRLVDNMKPADILRTLWTSDVQMQSEWDSPFDHSRLEQRMSSEGGKIDTQDVDDHANVTMPFSPWTNNEQSQAVHEPHRLSRLLPLLEHLRLGTGSKEDANELTSIISVLTWSQIEVLPELDQATVKAIQYCQSTSFNASTARGRKWLNVPKVRKFRRATELPRKLGQRKMGPATKGRLLPATKHCREVPSKAGLRQMSHRHVQKNDLAGLQPTTDAAATRPLAVCDVNDLGGTNPSSGRINECIMRHRKTAICPNFGDLINPIGVQISGTVHRPMNSFYCFERPGHFSGYRNGIQNTDGCDRLLRSREGHRGEHRQSRSMALIHGVQVTGVDVRIENNLGVDEQNDGNLHHLQDRESCRKQPPCAYSWMEGDTSEDDKEGRDHLFENL
ncbi:hypothetical protein C8F04DRAFT_1201875 [Mycena alexandri]|uniref:Uncharacterized protein n=1 Tax=Mycena alexandri TaxID=1745969 RepID=A0AAD6RW90_9AGAR|nr:hypothetical protein C8F04DRAFT_1201875 [Mycena alexandri]